MEDLGDSHEQRCDRDATQRAQQQPPAERHVSCSGFRVQGAGCRVQGAGCRAQGSGCRVSGSGCRVQGSGSNRPRNATSPSQVSYERGTPVTSPAQVSYERSTPAQVSNERGTPVTSPAHPSDHSFCWSLVQSGSRSASFQIRTLSQFPDTDLISQNAFTNLFWKVNSPTKLSTHCILLLIKMSS